MTLTEHRLETRDLARLARSAAADVLQAGWRRRAGGATELRSGLRLAADADHEVVAPSAPAWSVHVYSPPLTTMSCYGADGLTRVRTEDVSDTSAEFHESPDE